MSSIYLHMVTHLDKLKIKVQKAMLFREASIVMSQVELIAERRLSLLCLVTYNLHHHLKDLRPRPYN